MFEYQCVIKRVVDGDTVHLEVDLGCDVHVSMVVRLAHINAPEMNTQAGKDAKAYAVEWVSLNQWPGNILTIRTIKDRKEKYGRYLGVIVNPITNMDMNSAMVSAGHAVPYEG